MNNIGREFDDLDWQAFRYIANEMTEAEQATFEERLGLDSRTCEAVARMVDLSNTVARTTAEVVPVAAEFKSVSAFSQKGAWFKKGSGVVVRSTLRAVPATTPDPFLNHAQEAISRKLRWRRTATWSTAVAASLVAAVFLHQFFNLSNDPSTLAKLWAKVGFGSDAFPPAGTELLAGYEDEFLSTEDETDLSVPAWVIEAVGNGSDSDQREDS